MSRSDTQLAVSGQAGKPSALVAMAGRLAVDPEELKATLKSTVFQKASDAEFLALLITSNEYQLNPILKEIYAFPQKGGGIVPVVGVDGWMKIINRQPDFDGIEVSVSEDGKQATCKIYTKNRSHPTVVTEYLSECKRSTDPWNTMPRRMLRHKAIIQCGRVAFGIGGIHDEDEAADIGAMRNATPQHVRSEVVNPFGRQKQIAQEPAVAQQEPEQEPESEANVADPDPDPMSEIGEKVGVSEVTFREGGNAQRKWTMYTCELIRGGQQVIAKTFSSRVGKAAQDLVGSSAMAILTDVPGKGLRLDEIAPAGAAKATQEEIL